MCEKPGELGEVEDEERSKMNAMSEEINLAASSGAGGARQALTRHMKHTPQTQLNLLLNVVFTLPGTASTSRMRYPVVCWTCTVTWCSRADVVAL